MTRRQTRNIFKESLQAYFNFGLWKLQYNTYNRNN